MIEVEIKQKKFKEHFILSDFKCSIDSGELIAIVGVSGSGKSTLLNIIGLLDNDYLGNVTIDGVDTKRLKENERTKFIRYNISYLFQNYALIAEQTVRENLLYSLEYCKMSKKQKEAEINKILDKMGLLDKVGEKIYALSGGQQQRVSLARTILKPSKIILADEPTGNLDVENTKEVMGILREINAMGKTVIIVTHNNEIADNCDRIITLK